MAEDAFCGQEMKTALSCRQYLIRYADGEDVVPTRHGNEERLDAMPYGNRCSDCGVEMGGIHHPGCDWAECPRCGEQLMKHEAGINVVPVPDDCHEVVAFIDYAAGKRYDAETRTITTIDQTTFDDHA